MNFTLRKQYTTNDDQRKQRPIRTNTIVHATAFAVLLALVPVSSVNLIVPAFSARMVDDAEPETVPSQQQEEEKEPLQIEDSVTDEDENTSDRNNNHSPAADISQQYETVLRYLEDFGHKLGYENGDETTGWEWGETEVDNDPPDPPRLQTITQDVAEPNSKQALKVTVDPNDLVESGARAEVKHSHNESDWFKDGEEVYYKWYTKIPVDFPMSDTWHIITQWHQKATGGNYCLQDDTQAGCRGVPLGINVRDYDNDGDPTLELLVINRAGSNGNYFDILWSQELTVQDRNNWHEFLLHIRWSGCDKWNNEQCTREDNGAAIEFWFNGKAQQLQMPDRTFYNMDKDNVVYMKQGMYHCRLGSNKCPYTSSSPALTIYHDGMEYFRCGEDIPDSDPNKGVICNFSTPQTSPTPQVDPDPPTLTVPNSKNVITTDIDGAPVTYAVTAHDAVDGDARLGEDNTLTQEDSTGGNVVISCNPASGSEFPVDKTTTVRCRATDAAGNTGTGSFTVTVTYDCANAQRDIKAINSEIDSLSSDLQDSIGSQKTAIVIQIHDQEEKRDMIEQKCGI